MIKLGKLPALPGAMPVIYVRSSPASIAKFFLQRGFLGGMNVLPVGRGGDNLALISVSMLQVAKRWAAFIRSQCQNLAVIIDMRGFLEYTASVP